MRPDNGSLAEHPDHFTFARSNAKTATFVAIGVILLAGAVAALLNIEELNRWGIENASGRRGRMLGPYLGWVAAGLGAFLGAWAVLHGLRTGTWHLANGQRLKQETWVLNGDLDNAHERLATADPNVYLPLPVTRRSDDLRRRLRAYTPEGMPVTYLTITMGAGNNERHWPLITFEGPAHQAFQSVSGRLGKPYKG